MYLINLLFLDIYSVSFFFFCKQILGYIGDYIFRLNSLKWNQLFANKLLAGIGLEMKQYVCVALGQVPTI